MTITKTDPVTAAQTALVEAEKTLREHQVGLQAAQTRVETIKRSWERGDASVTALEKLEADAEVDRLSTLIWPAQRAVTAAERKLKSLTPVLAEKVAHTLGDIIFGAEAQFATAAPAKASDVPKVFVKEIGERRYVGYDTKPTKNPESGAVTGDVEIYVTGPEFMAEFDSTNVLFHLRSKGVLTGGHGHLQGPSVLKVADGIFMAKFRIDSAVPLLPIIPTINDTEISTMAGAGFSKTFLAVTASPSGSNITDKVGTGSTKVSEETVNGVRRVVMDVTISVRTSPHTVSAATEFLKRRYAEYLGLRGIGTIEKVEISTKAMEFAHAIGNPIAGTAVTARLTCISKEG